MGTGAVLFVPLLFLAPALAHSAKPESLGVIGPFPISQEKNSTNSTPPVKSKVPE